MKFSRTGGALANQLTRRPTNKLTVAAMVGPAATEVWGHVAPQALTGPAMSGLVGALCALLVGYMVRDRVNIAA